MNAISRLHVLLAACCALSGPAAQAAEPATTVITNARVADGTGAALRQANVRIAGDRIAQVGQFEPQPGERVIDAKQWVLAPGFIDIHNHSDDGLEKEPLAPTQISQGITTAILGLDGGSPWPIGEWLEARRAQPAALNIALMVGHATVRHQVLGADYRRTATPAEIERMVQLVKRAMDEGAIGISSGVEYDVASYSATEELVAVARASAQRGGFYMTHVRDEADKAFEALHEEIEIGATAPSPLQHSHIKLASVGVWNKAPDYIRAIEAAHARGIDLLADCYPYDAWMSTIKVLVPNKQYEDPKSVEHALADAGGGSRVTIVEFSPNRSYENRTLEQLAKAAGITPVEMYIRIIREGDKAGTEAAVIGQTMTEPDVQAFYQQPWVMVSSDGGIGAPHPRGAGTFPRVLGVYVREKKWLTLPEAIRKMTSLPARRLGWTDRGTIRVGAYADLVLFNPDTVIDRATFARPMELSTGIEKVFVNGVMVWSDGKPTQARPGVVISRTASAAEKTGQNTSAR